MCDNTYKTTFRLNLNKDRDYAIYDKIKDKGNINEYLKDCVENQTNLPVSTDSSIDMAIIHDIVKKAVAEAIKENLQYIKDNAATAENYSVQDEVPVSDKLNYTVHEPAEPEDDGLPDEALAFLDGLDDL